MADRALQQVHKELSDIKSLLNILIKQNAPFSLSAHEKGQVMAKAIEKSHETGDRSYIREAQKEINRW